MSLLKLILFNFVFMCSASPYVIELVATTTFVRLGDDASPPSLYVNEEFAFKVNVYKVKPFKIWCTKNNQFLLENVLKQNGQSYISKNNIIATMKMNGMWNCRLFHTPYKSVPLTILFDLQSTVKAERFAIDAKEVDSEPNSPSGNSKTARLIDSYAGNNYIDCSIYYILSQRKLVHNTTYLLHRDQPFTFNVHVETGVIKKGSLKWIVCNKKNKKTEIFINGPLTWVEGSKGHHYTAKVPLAVSTMEGGWECKFTPSIESLAPLSLEFKVQIKDPANPIPVSVQGLNNNIYRSTDNPIQSADIDDSQKDELAAKNDQIVIRFYKDNIGKFKIDVEEVPPLTLGQPFSIKVEDRANIFIFTRIKCHYMNNENYVYIDSVLNKINSYSYVSEVKNFVKQMAAKWKCYVRNHKQIDQSPIEFEVALKNTGIDSIHLFVNENRMNFTMNHEIKGMDFNSKSEYKYYEGELVKIRCELQYGNHIKAKLVLYNGTQIFDTQPHSDPVTETIYIKLTKYHHASYIDCEVTEFYLVKFYTYTTRLLFFMQTRRSNPDEPIIEVNDLTLAPNIRNEYFYEYYSGETLAILGYTEETRNSWFCTPKNIEDNNIEQLQPVENQHDRINLTVTLDYVMPSTLDCIVGNNPAVSLTLRPFNPFETFDPVIHGLTLSQTLLAYRQNARTYVMTYKNKENSNLKLVCMSKLTGCDWDYKSDVAETTTSPILSPSGATHDKNILSSGNDGDGDDPALSIEILIGIIIGTILIIILVIWLIVGLHKRKRKLEQVQASDINYENLPEHNEGPMQTPAQWNHYTGPTTTDETYTYCVPYVEKNLEEMYAQPQPKNKRQPEMLYAEVGAQEPTYAAVGQEASPTLYVNTKENQMPAYGQIQPKKLRDNAGSAPQVLPKPVNQNYAQVLPKIARKPVDGAQYENVCKDQRYVNAEGKGEYAEPAYCEVSKNK